MTGERRHRAVLWSMVVSAACLFVSRLLDDPYDAFGGPVLHFAVLVGSGVLAVISTFLLMRKRKT